jgi:hypothetical protein
VSAQKIVINPHIGKHLWDTYSQNETEEEKTARRAARDAKKADREADTGAKSKKVQLQFCLRPNC